METTRKSPKKSESKASDQKIKSAYIETVLTQGARPVSVYKFCLDLGIKEEEFYNVFGSSKCVKMEEDTSHEQHHHGNL